VAQAFLPVLVFGFRFLAFGFYFFILRRLKIGTDRNVCATLRRLRIGTDRNVCATLRGVFFNMTIYPAIDIKGGRCVRLTQGRADRETVYSENPAEVAAQFRAAGAQWVHVVDLDGAFSGESQNLAVVREIAAAGGRARAGAGTGAGAGLRVQLGGGMRTREAVERALALGVSRVVVGTRAAEEDGEDFVRGLVEMFGERIAVGIDAKDGQVAVKGWVASAGVSALALARRMAAIGVRTIIYTDIGTDGMLTGPNLAAQEAMLQAVGAGAEAGAAEAGAGAATVLAGATEAGAGCRVIASGGVSRQGDVSALAALAKRYANLDGVIIGKAIYEKRVDLGKALAEAET